MSRGAHSIDRWTLIVWRLLCLLTVMSGLAAVCCWDALPPLWQGLVVAPGLVVMLILIVAQWASWRAPWRGSDGWCPDA